MLVNTRDRALLSLQMSCFSGQPADSHHLMWHSRSGFTFKKGLSQYSNLLFSNPNILYSESASMHHTHYSQVTGQSHATSLKHFFCYNLVTLPLSCPPILMRPSQDTLWWNVLSTLFYIHDLRDSQVWLMLLWLTEESKYAPPAQRAQLIFAPWLATLFTFSWCCLLVLIIRVA